MIPRDVRYNVTSLPMQAGLVPGGAPAPAPSPIAALENVPGSMVVGIQATAQVHNTGTVPATWGIGAGSGLTVTPSTGTLAPGAVQPLTLDAAIANSYTLTLTVVGGTGGTAGVVVAPGAVAPTPSFIGAPTAGTVPFTTTFTNQSTGTYSSLLWDFGDGSTSTSPNPTHAYTVGGTYTVTLTLTWAGGTVQQTRTAYITANAAPTATALTLSVPSSGAVNVPVTVTVTPNNPIPIGGGTVTLSASNGGTLGATTLTFQAGSSAAQTTTLTRSTAGTSVVTMTNSMGLANNGSGATFTAGVATTATLSLPGTGITNSPTTGSVILNGVAPAAGSITLSGGAGATITPSTLSWAMGESGAAKNFTVSYAADGAHSVSITSGIAGVTVAGSPASHTTSAAPAAPIYGARQATLLSASVGTLPFAFGFACRKSDFPSSTGIQVTGAASARATVLSRWADGSALWVQVAGTAAAGAVITLASGTVAAGGAALTTSDLPAGFRSPGITITAGAFGSASWVGTDFDTPQVTWVATPEYSCWVYRKNIGSDPHLQGCAEVRLWANGSVDVLPWVENGRVRVAGPTNKLAVYTFSMAGVERFNSGATIDLKHHQRTPLLSGAALSYWFGADPGVTAKHDMDYLMSTRLVPAYRGKVPATAAAVTALPATWAPLAQGSFDYQGDTMSGAGYQPPIGLLPQHDVLHLTTTADTYASVVRNGYSAGRYGTHYRDEATGKPIRFSQYPTTVIGAGSGMTDQGASSNNDHLPDGSGGSAPQWDGAHQPSVGFLAALLTGRHYFMEEVQFAATANYLNITDTYRGGANGVFDGYRLQTRTEAWAVRTGVQAWALTPDADPLKTEFLTWFTAQIEHNHARYIAQPHNQFGLLANRDYEGTSFFRSSIWMNDFCVAAYGYAKALSIPVPSTTQAKFDAFYAWLGGSVVGRLQAQESGGYWWINAAPYTLAYASGTSINWLTGVVSAPGAWYNNWAEIYAATNSFGNNAIYAGTKEGILASGDGAVSATGYWGNLLPALTYCVEHNVPGARQAYDRVTGATNWLFLEHQFEVAPHWGTRPAVGADPAYLADKPFGVWFEIPNTALTTFNDGVQLVPAGTLDDYSGYVFNQAHGESLYFGGGHAGSSYNGTNRINWLADTPALSNVSAATPSGSRVSGAVWWGTAPNQKPNVPHTYNDGEFCAELKSYLWAAMRSPWNYSGTPPGGDIILRLKRDPTTAAGTWAQPGAGDDLATTYGASKGGTATAQDFKGNIYTINASTAGNNVRGIGKFSPGVGWSIHADSGLGYSGFGGLGFDSRRSRLVRVGDYSAPALASITIPADGSAGVLTDISASSSSSPKLNGAGGVLAAFQAFIGLDTVGAFPVPPDDAIWVPTGDPGGAYYRLDLSTLTVTLQTPPTQSGTVPGRAVTAGGVFKRGHCSQQLGVVFYHPNPAGNVWALRVRPR